MCPFTQPGWPLLVSACLVVSTSLCQHGTSLSICQMIEWKCCWSDPCQQQPAETPQIWCSNSELDSADSRSVGSQATAITWRQSRLQPSALAIMLSRAADLQWFYHYVKPCRALGLRLHPKASVAQVIAIIVLHCVVHWSRGIHAHVHTNWRTAKGFVETPVECEI